MIRLNYNADSTPEYMMDCFASYRKYLLSIREKLPQSAFDFAISDWHYDRRDHKCPQTSWVQSLEILERNVPQTSEFTIDIIINLLNRYEDGEIKIIYSGVRYYYLEKAPLVGVLAKVAKEPTTYHGDWVMDEIYLSEENLIVHEIELAFEARWKIHCKDIEYKWLPFEQN